MSVLSLTSQFGLVSAAIPANVGTDETDLRSYTMPVGRMSTNGDAIRVVGHFECNPTGGTKTVRFYFNGNVIRAFAIADGNTNFRIEAIIAQAYAATTVLSIVDVETWHSLTANNQLQASYYIGVPDAPVIKFSGQAGASDLVFCRGLMIEFIPAS